MQAGIFGLVHLYGFPHGISGAASAAVYGLMLGVARVLAGGLLTPWVAHVAIDLVLFALLVASAA